MSLKKIASKRRDAARRAAHEANMRLQHFLYARFWHGHGVHSPFVYHIVRHVITGRHRDSTLRNAANAYRDKLLNDKTEVTVGSMGAIVREPRRRAIREIARQTSISEKYGRLLARLAAEMKPRGILELGTSLGVSAAYMALACPESRLVSIEGLKPIADAAVRHLRSAGLVNVDVLCADIDRALPAAIEALPGSQVEMAFIDANHCYDATIRYFHALADNHAERCLLVFDDIFWSDDMTRAWREITEDPRVMTTIELPRMGLAFFRPGCPKEHYAVRW